MSWPNRKVSVLIRASPYPDLQSRIVNTVGVEQASHIEKVSCAIGWGHTLEVELKPLGVAPLPVRTTTPSRGVVAVIVKGEQPCVPRVSPLVKD